MALILPQTTASKPRSRSCCFTALRNDFHFIAIHLKGFNKTTVFVLVLRAAKIKVGDCILCSSRLDVGCVPGAGKKLKE